MPRPLADCAPPRLWRALCVEVLLIAAGATLAQLPWTKAPPQERPAPKPAPEKPPERRVRVIQLPREAPKLPLERPKPAPAPLLAKATPAPPAPSKREPPELAQPELPVLAQAAPPPEPVPALPPKPVESQPEPARPAPRPAPPTRIAADAREVHGVRLRVMVPRDPDELAAHLRGSGGCLVVSRLDREGAEVLSVLGIEGTGTVELAGPPCQGVPRLLNDAALDLALGDPLGRAQSAHPGERLALQVLLTPRLPAIAQETLRARFGDLPQDELARRAADAGYELTCFAEPAGSVRCE